MEEASIKIIFLDSLEVEDIIFKNTLLELYEDELVYKTSFEDALSVYSKEPYSYDLLILSFNKGDKESLGVINKFLSYNSGLKTVVINEFENKECIFKTIESGVNRVLLHPKKDENIKTNIHIVVEYIEQIKKLNQLNSNAQQCKRVVNEYKKAVDASTIFSISDLSGKIVYANKQFLKASGYTLDELREKPHSIVRHPDTSSDVFKKLWETIQNKEIWSGIVKNRAKDGSAYYVDATIVPILDRDNNIIEYAGIRHEITELINKTKELEDIKNKQRVHDIQKALTIKEEEIIASIPFATLFVDEDSSKIIFYNNIFSTIFSKHQCLKIQESTIADLFLEQDGYLYLSDTFPFYDSYELCDDEDRVVLVDIGSELKEFFIGIVKKEGGIIITLVPKR